VFENKALTKIFGSKRDEVTEEWRKLHNEELNDLFPSQNIIQGTKSKTMRWGCACRPHGGEERRTQGFSGET
jgi:hypothetical protein